MTDRREVGGRSERNVLEEGGGVKEQEKEMKEQGRTLKPGVFDIR